MSGLVRVALFAGFLAWGSWFGVGKPTVEDGRVWLEKVKADVETSFKTDAKAKVDPNAEPAPKEDNSASRGGDGALPHQTDAEALPAIRMWPELNVEASISKAWMVAEGPAYKQGDGRRLITLTFDDGPFPETTPTVLRILAKHKVHASFFVIGRYLDGDGERARASREVLKQIAQDGHLIGNHTYDHALLTSASITHTQVLEQIDQGAASIERVTGKRPVLFRPPFGKLDDFGRSAVRERSLDLLLWSVEKQDMRRADSHEVFRELVSQIEYKEGGIVLLHDIRWTSIAVLRELLGWLHQHAWDSKHPSRLGYEVVDLPTYLREVAASPLPYATRDELERVREAAAHARLTTRMVSRAPRASRRPTASGSAHANSAAVD